MSDDLIDMVCRALGRAWGLGQTYWQQADSESYSQNRKSEETQRKFDALLEETRSALSQAAPLGVEEVREQVSAALANEMVGAYDCTRVWEAWHVGTMGPDDFEPMTNRLDDVVDSVMTHITAIVQERDALEARVAELEGDVARDAARYRWLREGRMEFGVQPSSDPNLPKDRYWWCVDWDDPVAEVNHRIDAAIAASKEAP